MGTDFFDDDLSAAEAPRQQTADVKEEASARSAEAAARLAKQKEEVAEHAAVATDEIERLRRRQEELEKEKAELENLGRKQEEYERGKRDIIEKLERSVILVEKEEIQAARMTEVLSAMRARFKETLAEIKQIDEERWSDDEFKNELGRALAFVEEARMAYKKGMAKIEATRWQEGEAGRPAAPRADRATPDAEASGGFGFWLKAGLAFSLPLAVLIIVIFVLHLVFSNVR